MRTAIATLIVALAVGTAQAEPEVGQATEERGTEPDLETGVETGVETAVEPEAEHAAEPAAEPAVKLAAEDECLGSPVPVRRMGVRGSIWVQLADCKGRPFQAAAQALSALAVPLPPRTEETRAEDSGEDHGEEPGADALPRINPELLMRLQYVAQKYPGRTIEIVSGFRTRASAGSRHRHFDALDIRVDGVSNEELAAFARSFEATGVGYYPNSSFVHLDVREVAAYWVDESGPGEPAKYARKEALEPSAVADDSPAKTEAEIAAEAAIVAAKLAEPNEAKDEPMAAAKVEDETKDAPLTEEPASAEPVPAAEPATAEPAKTEPATAEPATAEPAAAEPAAAEPAAAEPVTVQPAKAAPVTSAAPVSPQLASIAERALIVMKRALGRAGVQDTAL